MSRWNDPYWNDEEPPEEEPERCDCCARYDGKHQTWCQYAPMTWRKRWDHIYFKTFSIYRVHMALKPLLARVWPKRKPPIIDDDIPF
jgi:hypothetical protein